MLGTKKDTLNSNTFQSKVLFRVVRVHVFSVLLHIVTVSLDPSLYHIPILETVSKFVLPSNNLFVPSSWRMTPVTQYSVKNCKIYFAQQWPLIDL